MLSGLSMSFYTLLYACRIQLTITTILFILITAPTEVNSIYYENYTTCRHSFRCGILSNILYPFWGGPRPSSCGHPEFKLSCPPNRTEHPTIKINGLDFWVLDIDEDVQDMTIARMDLEENGCAAKLINTTLNYNLFDFKIQSNRNLTLHYNCSTIPANRSWFNCSGKGGFFTIDGDPSEDSRCSEVVKVPVQERFVNELRDGKMKLKDGLNKGFLVDYTKTDRNCTECKNSGGICGSDGVTMEFSCLCPDGPSETCQPKKSGTNWKLKTFIGFLAMILGFVIAYVLFLAYLHRKKCALSVICRSTSPNPSKPDISRGIYLGLRIFSYDELQKATNNFDKKKQVGHGGFGTVYFGKLKDGRVVAVKRLYENNSKLVKQLMNEVEILGRLRHQNLVTLYGFTSHQSLELLLVYEYVANGTVAEHLRGRRAKAGALTWATRLKIATETASALAYLHASDIIHRDVKTANILLNNNFCAKVADFGLSRLFPTDVTHVLTAPQGTPGYLDPEYHQCYQLTEKSDVYSFGVVLIELISSKAAVDTRRHRDEINLAKMAMKKISNHELHELVDPNLGYGSDVKIQRMINDVADLAFRCLQSERDKRPSMAEVLDILKGILIESCNIQKAEELDVSADKVVFLRTYPLSHSPVSVAKNCLSA